MAPVLIHLHVPKCRGTSINRAIAAHFYERTFSKTADLARREKYARLTPQERDEQFDAVVGHLFYGEHRLFTRPCLYVSATRDPVERICSFFNHVHTHPEHPCHAYLREHLPDLNALDSIRVFGTDLLGQLVERFTRTYGGIPVAGESVESVHERILAEVRAGRILVAPFETVKAFLATIGIAEIPSLNVTDLSDPVGFVPARAEALPPRVRQMLEQRFCRHDYRLLEAIARALPYDGPGFADACGFGRTLA